ncbi:MAG: MgtC/SapB family protein [Anaeroplasmataceae bacterium]
MILTVITDYLLDILLPLAITFVFTWFIGLERQNIGKSAGISAHVLLGISCCGIALLQQHINITNNNSDNQRLIAGAITGIGFLGAGVILKGTKSITGLTTAATLFSAAVIGIIIGMQVYKLGITVGVFIMGFIYIRDISRKINPFKSHRGHDYHFEDEIKDEIDHKEDK